MPNIQPISDDQELAKVLAGVSDDDTMNQAASGDEAANQPVADGSEAIPEMPPVPNPDETQPAQDGLPQPGVDQAPAADFNPASGVPAVDAGNLESIKAAALQELRPLVDKLNVTPQEKFDVLLLLLRSTDDSSLVETAHAAAKDIVDETARAQALLDVIKEIDFLSNPQAAQQQ